MIRSTVIEFCKNKKIITIANILFIILFLSSCVCLYIKGKCVGTNVINIFDDSILGYELQNQGGLYSSNFQLPVDDIDSCLVCLDAIERENDFNFDIQLSNESGEVIWTGNTYNNSIGNNIEKKISIKSNKEIKSGDEVYISILFYDYESLADEKVSIKLLGIDGQKSFALSKLWIRIYIFIIVELIIAKITSLEKRSDKE